jgi:hypothetical protein
MLERQGRETEILKCGRDNGPEERSDCKIWGGGGGIFGGYFKMIVVEFIKCQAVFIFCHKTNHSTTVDYS